MRKDNENIRSRKGRRSTANDMRTAGAAVDGLPLLRRRAGQFGEACAPNAGRAASIEPRRREIEEIPDWVMSGG